MSDNGRACKACGAELIWAMTRDGKRAPIDKAPSAVGNVLVFAQGLGQIQARTFGGFALDDLRGQGVPLRTNHFMTCPNAQDFR